MTVADALFAFLLNTFPPDRDYTRDQLERSPMPALVAHYLGQTLQHRVELEIENQRKTRSDWFDYEHEEVQEAFQAYAAALAGHVHIPAAAWRATLRQAVHQVVDFLVRPARVLTEHVFQGQEGPLPAHVIYRRLGFFAAYPYLRDVIEAYLEQRSLEQIDRTRFTALLARIDRQMTEDYEPGDWIRLLEPLFELARTVPGATGGLPVSALRDFFGEKGAESIVRRLQVAEAEQGMGEMDPAALRRLIEAPEDAYREAPPPAAARASRPAPAPAEDRPVPLWKRFQHGVPDAPSRAAPPAKAPAPPAAATPSSAPAAGEQVPLWRRYQGTPEPAPEPTPSVEAPSSLADLERDVLGERGMRNRDLFVNALFAGSVEAYEHTLRRLRMAPNWTQASQVIAHEVFLKHQVNIYSDPAVTFTDAVEARFRG